AIETATVASAVNGERSVSGFGQVDGSIVAQALGALRTRHLEAAHHALISLEDPGASCLQLAIRFQDAHHSVAAFVDELVERFDAWANPELRRQRDTLFDVLSKISDKGAVSKNECAQLTEILSTWQGFVGPTQFVAARRGLVDPRTKEVFERI